MTKRVLITGASGFVGANVLDWLLDNTDWEFVAPCSWRHHGSPLRLNSIFLKDVKRQGRVDVGSLDLRHPLPDLGGFDYILNIASESHVDRSILNPVEFTENNVAVALHVLEYARHSGCERFIQFSTDEVFGPDGQGPSSPYAGSKAAQEAIAHAYRVTYGVPVVITNSSNIVGPMQDKEKFVPKLVDQIKNGKKVTLHTHNGIYGKRYYDAIENVASALHFILEKSAAIPLGQYQLGPGIELDNFEMAKAIAECLNLTWQWIKVKVDGIRPGYDEHYHHVGSSLHQFGWEPVTSFENGLKRAVLGE